MNNFEKLHENLTEKKYSTEDCDKVLDSMSPKDRKAFDKATKSKNEKQIEKIAGSYTDDVDLIDYIVSKYI